MSHFPEMTGKKLTSTAMCKRFGIVRRTLARWMVDPSMGLPESLIINHRHYWDESDIVQWERSRAASNLKAA